MLFNLVLTLSLRILSVILLLNSFQDLILSFHPWGIILAILSSVSALSSSDLKYLLASESLFG
ncbi:hypothetical protein RRG43_02455 [Mycoplasmopsis cynos]|uniref:hypothetical protein n=1 Tax=Mycoplasmopsis cynos TaxID=171284 RepID=UPI002AFFFFB8|nr:hypothetical protein [Mycoplasmopsis cynos]WQQ15192.1 hypothetical protein RRG43_02455 [Mycoplasmopsis cynos]